LCWFRLTPFVFWDDPTKAFFGGLVLLIPFGLLSKILPHTKPGDLKTIFHIANFIFLYVNASYLDIHMPRIESAASCNGINYYITHGAPLLDEQWTYIQLSKWTGLFDYESHFYGYAPGSGGNEIICDTERKEAHFIRDKSRLIFIDGQYSQGFEEHASARLEDNLYFMSEDWSLPENCSMQEYSTCGISIFTLYKCELNFTNCNSLPVTYTTGDTFLLELRANEAKGEISLFEQYFGDWKDETIIFTYGDKPQCYVDGCTISVK